VKGRILFALVFVAFLALGIHSLGDLQSQAALLPAQSRLTVYVSAAPAAADTRSAPEPAQDLQQTEDRTCSLPPAPSRSVLSVRAPKLQKSYYLACYQAFHYSDCAG